MEVNERNIKIAQKLSLNIPKIFIKEQFKCFVKLRGFEVVQSLMKIVAMCWTISITTCFGVFKAMECHISTSPNLNLQ